MPTFNRIFAQVALLRRTSRQHDFFDYEIPPNLVDQVKPGCIVKIPFLKQYIHGVVLNITSHSQISKIKPIATVINKNFFSPSRLSLLQEISKNHGVSISSVVKLFTPLPETVKHNYLLSPVRPDSGGKGYKKWIFEYRDAGSLAKTVLDLINKVKTRGQETLLLCPDIKSVNTWNKHLVKEKPVIWHSELKTSEAKTIWNSVVTNRSQIIIGTRSSIFLPISNLGAIIIIDEENENYKQIDQNPHYDTLELADSLAQYRNIPLASFSAAPRLETWHEAQKKHNYQVIGAKIKSPIKLIDLSTPSRRPFYLLSEEVYAEIQEANAQNKLLLYYNRRGDYKLISCSDCGWVATCPRCTKNLTLLENSKSLNCYSCFSTREMPIACPTCHGANIKLSGAGVEQIKKELQKLFPQKHIMVLDKAEYSSPSLVDAEVVIATSKIFQIEDYQWRTIVILSLESELAIPEFRSEEFAWQKIKKLVSLNPNKLLVQSKNINSIICQHINSNSSDFYNAIVTDRKTYSWPPFCNLLRISVTATDQTTAQKSIKDIFYKLEKIKAEKKYQIAIVPPYADWGVFKRKNYVYHTLIKYQDTRLVPQIISLLPNDAIIDKGPRYILS